MLFTPHRLGLLALPNRIVMPPMTRSRAADGNVATAEMAAYYAQRASAGLIVSEGTQISPQGQGYAWTPGIHSPEQVQGWRQVTDAVHAAGGRIYAQERRGQAGSVPGQTNPAGTLPGGHVYAQEDEKKDPKPGPTVETPGDKPGDSTSVPSQRVFCCCLLVDLKIIVKEDPIVRNKPEQAGEVAHVVVRITFSWRKDPKLTKNLPCILQWWEYTDNPYPPATKGRATLRKNTWTDLSKNQRGLAQVFPPWTSAMGGGTEEGEQKIECLDQSREIVMTDEVRFPGGAYADATIKDRPSFPGLDRLESSRSLSGVVRVFSGCPNGPKSSKAWHVGNSHYWYDTNFQGRKGWPALPKGETSSPFPNSEQVLWPKPPGETPLTPTTKYVDNPPNVGKPPANPPSDQATAPDPDRQGQPTTAGPGTVASPEQQAQSNLPDSDDR